MSHALRVGVADQIGYFRAYNTDGSAKTDLSSSTTGLALSVFRVGASAVSISSLSAKAADNTAHADGAIRAVSGNLYTVDLPDATCADQVPSISVKGAYTGGVIEGPEHPLVGYNPASVAVGANTVAPENSTIALIYALLQLTDSDVASIVTLLGTPAGASIAADLLAIKISADAALRPTTPGETINLTEGAPELDSAGQQLIADLTAMIEGSPSDPIFTQAALANAPASGGGGGGLTTEQDTMLTEIHEGIYPEDPEAPSLVITPGVLNETTGWAVVRNADNSPAANVQVFAWLVRDPPRTTGEIVSLEVRTFLSAVNGVVQIPNLVKGYTYNFAAGTMDRPARFTVRANAEPTTPIPTLVRT